jgi:hypothetical protein
MSYHARGESYEPYESDGISGIASPYTPGSEFFSNPGSPEIGMTKDNYTTVPVRQISGASTVHSVKRKPTLGNILRKTKSREQQQKWGMGVHWFMPTAMLCLLLAGVFGAFGHHMYYKSLNDKDAKDQLMRVRYGTALAFFTKASLVGSVALAYRSVNSQYQGEHFSF